MTDAEYRWTAEVEPPDSRGGVRLDFSLAGTARVCTWVLLEDTDDPTAAAEALAAKINRPAPAPRPGPLRVERGSNTHDRYKHTLHYGENGRTVLTDAEADDIEAQLAAPDLPPHVAQALEDGLPDGVRVGLVANGRDIPDGWEHYLGPFGGWRQESGLPARAYEVRPPVPPAEPHIRVKAEAVEVCRKALMQRFSDDFEMEDIAAAAHAAAELLGRAALPEDGQR